MGEGERTQQCQAGKSSWITRNAQLGKMNRDQTTSRKSADEIQSRRNERSYRFKRKAPRLRGKGSHRPPLLHLCRFSGRPGGVGSWELQRQCRRKRDWSGQADADRWEISHFYREKQRTVVPSHTMSWNECPHQKKTVGATKRSPEPN